jgi:alpha-glucosidase
MLKGTTFAHQLATAVVFTSPLTHWADKPSNYLRSSAKDVLVSIPPTWDETRVLPPSKIGEVAVLARRNGDTWFLGVLNGKAEKSFDIALSFLDEGPFAAIILSDNLDKADAIERSEKEVRAGETIHVKLRPGGGCVARFEPARKEI